MDFKLGERIIAIGGAWKGERGVIIRTPKRWQSIAVRFDKSDPQKHNCEGLCENGHGWFAEHHHIKSDKLNWEDYV